MSYKITIKFTKPVKVEASIPTYPIAPEFVLGQSYVDDKAFRDQARDTAYSKNIWEKGEFLMAQDLAEFLGEVSVHPGVVLACKSAILAAKAAEDASSENAGYEFITDDYKDKMLYEEIGRALAGQGFEVTVDPT